MPMVLRTGWGVLAVFLVPVCTAQGIELSNGVIKARFDDRGLVSLADSTHGEYPFSSDAFWAVVDGRKIDPSRLPRPTADRAGLTLTYRYAANGFTIDVVYEMRPAWGFVSKQLRIQSSESRVFRVDALAPFRTSLAQAIQGEFVPSHPSEKLGTADYGGFLRLESRRGLLTLVQNPFLRFVREDHLFEISYRPEMDWNPAWG